MPHGEALETAQHMTDGRQLRFMFLPDGEDLTRWYEEGKEAFETRMEQAMPLPHFWQSMRQVDLVPDERARLSALALPLISQVRGETRCLRQGGATN